MHVTWADVFPRHNRYMRARKEERRCTPFQKDK